jgi:HSP20 family protein
MPIRQIQGRDFSVGTIVASGIGTKLNIMNDFTVNIEKQLSRLGRDLQDFVEKIVPVQEVEGDFSPSCDIVESDTEFRILMDLPGMNKKDIQISLREHVLRISGERLFKTEEHEKVKRNERKSGAFSRSFAIPEYVDTSETSASFKNGVLTVKMPKTNSEEDAQSIPIH